MATEKMRQIVILSITIALLLAVAVEGQSSKRICRPDSEIKVKCNTCRCNADGTDMACTKKSCPPNRTLESSEPFRVNKRMVKTWCEPGTTFKVDCNYCRCSEDGTKAACTLKNCLKI